MLTLDREDRALLVAVHRWARTHGWVYDATTYYDGPSDFRWKHRESTTTVTVTVDHEKPSPWDVRLDIAGRVHAEFAAAEVQTTLDVLVALGAAPPAFGSKVTRDRLVAATRGYFQSGLRAEQRAKAYRDTARKDRAAAQKSNRRALVFNVLTWALVLATLALVVWS